MKQFLSLMAGALLLASSLAMASKTAGDHVDDSWIHTKVKTTTLGHGSGDINIEVYKGRVLMAGFLTSKENIKAALEGAAEIKGVNEVIDQLHYVEPGRSAGTTLDDNVIAGNVKTKLHDGDFSRGFDINVEVNRGVVLISGFASKEAREASADIASRVKGVQKVLNGIAIK